MPNMAEGILRQIAYDVNELFAPLNSTPELK